MEEDGKYRDIHQAFFREAFGRALDYDAYLAAANPKHSAKWLPALERTRLNREQERRLGSFTRRMNVLMLSGVWCGDCVRQGPILKRMADVCGAMELRFLERDAERDLAEMVRLNGALRVPVTLFLSEDFFEVSRAGDRWLSVYRRKAAREVGDACDTGLLPPEGEELAAETAEWMDEVERVQLLLRTAPMLRERYGD